MAMGEFTYTEGLRVLSRSASVDLDQMLAAACSPAWGPVVYLADFSRQSLFPLTADLAPEGVAGTLAGRVFTGGDAVTSVRDGHVRVWVPVMEQTARIGVLALSFPSSADGRAGSGADSADLDPEDLRQAESLGVFAGLVIASMTRMSDTPWVRRQGRSMSLPASMQWDLLPSWALAVPGARVAGMLEPAYDVAGDVFDYAVNDGILHFAVIDGMGHGIGATLLAGLAVGAYRHARRGGAAIEEIHVAMDEALAGGFEDLSFATGIIGRLALDTGWVTWSCAGHPRPLLLRDRKVVAELDGDFTVPFGLGTGAAAVNSMALEPGDALLLYTDGVTDGRVGSDELFGEDRLTDLLEREAASETPPEEMLRRLVRAVLDYQGGELRDDATLLLLQWTGA
jgi:serine phosphatase RsbU (regulator of sigma subunit)